MRRSAAPSQQGPAPKKICFVPPVATHSEQPDVISKCDNTSKVTSDVANISRSVCDIVNLIQNSSNNSTNFPPQSNVKVNEFHIPEKEPLVDLLVTNQSDIAKPTFQPPTSSLNGQSTQCNGTQRFKSRPQLFEAIQPNSTVTTTRVIQSASHSTDSTSSVLSSDHVPAKYFSVMWCKVSKKKHKKWEGDAILIARQRSVTLVDMEGKEIGRSTGYKTSELEALTDGQMLVIGGKEIEVMGVLSEEQFTSGKCFQSTPSGSFNGSAVEKPSTAAATLSHPVAVTVSKPFVRPFKTGDAAAAMHLKAKSNLPIQPYFNPAAPNALVMPRPADSHQWQHNSNGSQVVDVVVDPHIAVHLRPHQRLGVVFLYQCVLGMRPHRSCGAILADEMGLGKTLQCIALIWTLYKQGPYGGRPVVKRVLILTPGSLMKNWFKEFRKWLSSERLSVYTVNAENSVEDFVKLPRFPVMIVSYEMFMRNIETIRKINFDLLICDEGHRLKNASIKTAMCASSLSVSRRIVLTGTPVQNDLQELYALADFCNPGILGTLSAFRRVYEEPIIASRQPSASEEDQELGRARASELGHITDSFILRRTQEINNQYLPPRVDVVLFCALSELQLKLYRALIRSRAVLACLRDSDTAQHLRCISALRKLCNHPHLLHENAIEAGIDGASSSSEADLYRGLQAIYPEHYNPSGQTEHSGKMKVLESLLHRISILTPVEKVVLVSNYTSTLNLIENLCKSYGFPLLRLDGQTPTSRRMELVERFNSRSSPEFIFLLSSKAGGLGLNLIGASRLILYDIDWNPANDMQAMARVWRDGQRRCCYIYRLLCTGTIEEKIYQRQVAKQGLSGAVVDAEFSRSPAFDVELLRELFSLDEDTLCSTHQLISCNCISSTSGGVEQVSRRRDDTRDERECQLQLRKSASNLEKNTGMDELLDWTHVAGHCPDLAALDPALEPSTLCTVTFAMWTKSNSFNQENSLVVSQSTTNSSTVNKASRPNCDETI